MHTDYIQHDTSAIPNPGEKTMGNSASVTVGNIKLSIPEAAQLEDQIKAMPEVKAYRERQAKEAEEKRLKVLDWAKINACGTIFQIAEACHLGYTAPKLMGWHKASELTKLTPDEIATLNRIAARMGE